MYNPIDQSKKLGWIFIDGIKVPGDGVQAPGYVTVCNIGGRHPYVVHFFNCQDGGFHMGNYCATWKEAQKVFAQKVARYVCEGSEQPWFDSPSRNDEYFKP